MKMFVLTDRHMWTTAPLPGSRVGEHHVAFQGDEIDVSEAEAQRGVDLGTLSASSGDLVRSEATAGELAAWPDEQLNGENVEGVIAYMGQRPSEAERVLALEAKRSKPRKTVLEAGERIIAARDEELDRIAASQDVARAAAAGAPAVGANG